MKVLQLVNVDDLAAPANGTAISSLGIDEQRDLYARWLRAKVREHAAHHDSDLITVPAQSVERIASLLEAMPHGG
jgi:hypothetical protein